MALLSKNMRKRRERLERGLQRGNWSESHKKRARDQLAQIMAVRKRRSEDRTLYNPSHTLGGPELRQSVDTLVEGEVAPLRRQAQGLEALGGRVGGQVSQVFMDLAQRQAAQLGQLGGLQAQAAQRLEAGNQSAADRLGQIQESVDSSLGRVEDDRIAPYRQQAVNALAEQRAQAARSGQAFAGMQAGQAEAARNFAAEMAASAHNRGAEIGGDIRRTTQGRVGDVMAEIANIQGPGRTKLLQQMRQDERQWLGEQQVFGLNTYKAEQDVAIEKGKLTLAQRAARTKRRADKEARDLKRSEFIAKYGMTPENYQAMSPAERLAWTRKYSKAQSKSGGGKGAGGRTPSQVREDERNRNKARAKVRSFNEAKGGRLSKDTANGQRLRERAINGLMDDFGYSEREARRIVYAQVGYKKQKKRHTTAGS